MGVCNPEIACDDFEVRERIEREREREREREKERERGREGERDLKVAGGNEAIATIVACRNSGKSAKL